MHAYGLPPTSTQSGRVVVDHIPADAVNYLRLSNCHKLRMSVTDAEKLQRQLGVAIREAVGQTSIEALDNPGIGTIPLG